MRKEKKKEQFCIQHCQNRFWHLPLDARVPKQTYLLNSVTCNSTMVLPYGCQMTHDFKVQRIKCPDLESVHLNTNACWQFHLMSVMLAGEFGCGAGGVHIHWLSFRNRFGEIGCGADSLLSFRFVSSGVMVSRFNGVIHWLSFKNIFVSPGVDQYLSLLCPHDLLLLPGMG